MNFIKGSSKPHLAALTLGTVLTALSGDCTLHSPVGFLRIVSIFGMDVFSVSIVLKRIEILMHGLFMVET